MLSEELEQVLIGQDEEKYFQVGSQIPSLEKVALVKFLEDNIYVLMTYLGLILSLHVTS